MDIARITHELRNCKICGAEFKFYAAMKNATGQYCSLQCKGVGLRKKPIVNTCLYCKKEFTPAGRRYVAKFCNNACYAKTMEGVERPSFWETASYEEQIERLRQSFEKYVIRQDGCWGWKGSVAKKYGSLQFGGKYKSISAHRASYLLHKGPLFERMFVCHTCDNPICTNPDHLFLGTATDNVRDMIKKGRNNPPKGERAIGVKLKESEVLQIIELLKENNTLASIAEKFNVHIVTIFDIKHRKTWKHLFKDQ